MNSCETSSNDKNIKLDTLSVEKYLNSLSDHERKTMEIAKEHLGTSFNINKSIGYIEWKSKQ
jgi:hypothetical protein